MKRYQIVIVMIVAALYLGGMLFNVEITQSNANSISLLDSRLYAVEESLRHKGIEIEDACDGVLALFCCDKMKLELTQQYSPFYKEAEKIEMFNSHGKNYVLNYCLFCGKKLQN